MANGSATAASSALACRQYAVARSNHGCPATAGSCRATRCASAATTAVICNDGTPESASTQNGAQPAGSAMGSANGSPP
jgi:hypothetical protein